MNAPRSAESSRITLGLTALYCLAGLAEARELEGVYQPTTGPCPTVEEQIAKATLPDGYALRCFASEPMVVNPVAMTWDHRGRLWVVELYEYPSGAKNPNEYSKTATDEKFRPVINADASSPRDRVTVLEDTDNDGKADKRTVFVDGLNLATGILCGRGGVLVGQAPNLFFFRDTDGDDKADDYKTVLTGFGLEDRHELLNGFTWGPDGNMYFTHGVFTHSKVRRPEEPDDRGFTLNAGIYRAKFERGDSDPSGSPGRLSNPTVVRHEVFADGTSNPWGCDYDAQGNWFVEACVIDHLFHMAPGGLYSRQGGAPENPYAYELLPSIVPKDHPRHFRAAYAGIQVYQGGAYPADTHGHLFFGNIHDSSIHQERLEPVGATFKAHIVRDFLRANNGWFRPVSVQTGPDGFLWVMDWCDKYPCYQNAQANPAGVDREKGRIWRVVLEGQDKGSRSIKELNLAKLASQELMPHLKSLNNWFARAAVLELSTRLEESEVQGALRRLLVEESPTSAEIDAAASLIGSPDGLKVGDIDRLANSPLPYRRKTAARLIGDWWLGVREIIEERPPTRLVNEPNLRDLGKVLARLAGDQDAFVRSEALSALRLADSGFLTVSRSVTLPSYQLSGKEVLEAALRAAPPQDRAIRFGIWMALEPRLARQPAEWTPWLAGLASQTKPHSVVLTYKTMRRLCDTRQPENIDLALAFLDTVAADGDLVATGLDGLVKGQEAAAIKPRRDSAPYFERWVKHERDDVRGFGQKLATLWGDANAIAALMGTALSEASSVEARISAIQTVRKLKDDKARAGIATLLDSQTPDELTVEVLRAAAELGGRDFPALILKAWARYSPALRRTAADVLTSRAEWAGRLLDAVEGKWVTTGKLDPATLPVTVHRYFATAAPDNLKARAKTLLGTWNETGGDVKALILKKRAASLHGEPDLATGRALFTAACATCHVFHGGGQEVGPELMGSGRSSLDALINNVIDPNQIIGNGYQNIVVTTKDGRTLSGRLTEDSPVRVRLLGIGGREEVVARDQIEKLEDTRVSLMPAGFGELPDEQFRDLMWFILAPPEEGPLTPEKKAALAAPVTEAAEATDTDSDEGHDRIDWESVSLWNPDWKVAAPEFEGTPRKHLDYHGRKHVLELHPFADDQRPRPAALVRTLAVPADKPSSLVFDCASHDQGNWDLVVRIDGEVVQKRSITPDAPRWKNQSIPLEKWKGRTVDVSLENHASDWMFEFSYWADLRLE
ncbi:MAG: PVC-type heme-binding CxxCH protein [Verrucomicrobiales bacterium]